MVRVHPQGLGERVSARSMPYPTRSRGRPSCARSRRALYSLPEDRLPCSRIMLPLSGLSKPRGLRVMLTRKYDRVQRRSPSVWKGRSPNFSLKLFGKEPKASQPSVFDAKKRPIEAPSYLLGGPQSADSVTVSLFQTVSPRGWVNNGALAPRMSASSALYRGFIAPCLARSTVEGRANHTGRRLAVETSVFVLLAGAWLWGIVVLARTRRPPRGTPRPTEVPPRARWSRAPPHASPRRRGTGCR